MHRDGLPYHSFTYCVGSSEIWFLSFITSSILIAIGVFHLRSKEGRKDKCGIKSWLLVTVLANQVSIFVKYSINGLPNNFYIVQIILTDILQSFAFLMLSYLFVTQGLNRIEKDAAEYIQIRLKVMFGVMIIIFIAMFIWELDLVVDNKV
jgi:hypothetical protein